MAVKVIACDMDGTFLDAKGRYDRPRFEKILKELEARDIKFVVASGNGLQRLHLIFDGLEDRLSYVAENGGFILENNQPFIRHYLDKLDVIAFLEYFEGKWADYRVMVSHEDKSYTVAPGFSLTDFPMIDEKQMAMFLSKITLVDHFSELPDEPVLKTTMLLPLDQCEEIIQEFNERFSGNMTAVTSGYGSVDVIQTGIHKAWGLHQLLAHWEISPDEVMAFGDGGNDIELLEFAGYSYAMDNAPDTVKAAAKYLAPSHTESGVLTVLEAYLEGEIYDRREIG